MIACGRDPKPLLCSDPFPITCYLPTKENLYQLAALLGKKKKIHLKPKYDQDDYIWIDFGRSAHANSGSFALLLGRKYKVGSLGETADR